MAAAFATAGDAVASAIAIKDALAAENWRTAGTVEGADRSAYRRSRHRRRHRLREPADQPLCSADGRRPWRTDRHVRSHRSACPRTAPRRGRSCRTWASTGCVTSVLLCVFTNCSRRCTGRTSHHCGAWKPFPGICPGRSALSSGERRKLRGLPLLSNESRVVTITGVGGVGKTRLAVQVAADLLPRYRDGAWLVELAPVRDGDSAVDAVAAVFNMTNIGAQSREDSACRNARSQRAFACTRQLRTPAGTHRAPGEPNREILSRQWRCWQRAAKAWQSKVNN